MEHSATVSLQNITANVHKSLVPTSCRKKIVKFVTQSDQIHATKND